jgi:hypothetical protein
MVCSRLLDVISDLHTNPWYIIAAVAFSASNRPEAVPDIFQCVLQDCSAEGEKLLLARKMRDAIFKSGLSSGYPRVRQILQFLRYSYVHISISL